MGQEMGPKRLEFAHQLVPNGNAFAALVNPKYPLALAEARDMQAAAHSLSLRLTVLDGSTEGEIDAVFAGLARQKADALLAEADALEGPPAKEKPTKLRHHTLRRV